MTDTQWQGDLSLALDAVPTGIAVITTGTLAEMPRRRRNANGPMLAKRFNGADDVDLLAQPKLNGIRLIATAAGVVTRGGHRLTALPHIERALAPLFSADPALELDGELYRHGMPLPIIAGVARRNELSPESARLEFHVFDLVSPAPATVRAAMLVGLLRSAPDCLVPVSTTLCAGARALDAHYARCLADGYEGQMIRPPHACYQRGRSGHLLKRKPAVEADEVIADRIMRAQAAV